MVPRPDFAPGSILLGVGLGGFVDGIVLHQLLQWHHLLTATDSYGARTIHDLEANTIADGLFHLGAWIVVVAGLARMWAARGSGKPTTGSLVGGMLVGWGGFNLVEGIVDHHVLRIHHVRDDVADPLPWDLAFLGLSVALVVAGTLVASRASAPENSARGRAQLPPVEHGSVHE
jgi:uncharacterized membrane protein